MNEQCYTVLSRTINQVVYCWEGRTTIPIVSVETNCLIRDRRVQFKQLQNVEPSAQYRVRKLKRTIKRSLNINLLSPIILILDSHLIVPLDVVAICLKNGRRGSGVILFQHRNTFLYRLYSQIYLISSVN